jgi:hypothetical protein
MAIPCHTSTFIINGRHRASDHVEAVIPSLAVHEQLFVDTCTKTFVVSNDKVDSAYSSSVHKHVSGNEIVVRQSSQKSLILLSRLLFNTAQSTRFQSLSSDEIAVAFETLVAWTSVAVSASQFDLYSIANLWLPSID